MQNNKQELENKLAQTNQDIAQKQTELNQKKSLFTELNSDKRKIIINPEDKAKTVKTEGDCDLLALDVDAIVNAANNAFHGGMGIDGVIGENLNEGGKLYDESRTEAIAQIGKPVTQPTPKNPYPSIENATGKGVLTKAYPNASFKNKYKNSPIKYVVHMVAPSISSTHFKNPSTDEKEKFYSSIRNAFELVKEKDDIKTIGFPAIGCGAFGWSFKIFFEIMFNAYKDFVEKNPGRDLKVYIAIFDPSYGKSKEDGNLEFKTSKLATDFSRNLFEQKLKAFEDEIKNLENEIQKQEAAKKTIEDQIKNLGSKDANEKKLKALKENYNGQEILEADNIKKLITDLESKLEISEKDFNSALENVKARINYEIKKAKLDKLINKYKFDDQYKRFLEDQEIKSIITFTYSSLSSLVGSGFYEKLGEIEFKINLKKDEMDNESKNKPKLDKLLAEYKNNEQYEKILEVEDIKDLIVFTIKNECKAENPKDFDDYLAKLKEKIENRKRIIDNHAKIDKLLNEYKNNQYKNIFEIEDIRNMIQLLHDKLLSKKEDFDKNLKLLAEKLGLEKNKIDNKAKLNNLLAKYKNNKQYEKILELENIKSLITDLESKLEIPEKSFDEALRNLATKIRIEENKARLNNLLAKYKNDKKYEKILELENIKESIKYILENNLGTGPLFTIEWLSELEEELKLEKKKIDEAEAKAKISDDEINKLKDFWLAVYKVIYFCEPKKFEQVEKALNEKDFIRNNLDAFKSSVDDLKKEIVAHEKNIKDMTNLNDKDLEQAEKILSDTSKSKSLYNKLDAVAKSKIQRSVTIGGSAGFAVIFAALTIFLGTPVALPFIFGGVAGVSLIGNLSAHKIISKKIGAMDKNSRDLVENEKVKPVSKLINIKNKTSEEIKNTDAQIK